MRTVFVDIDTQLDFMYPAGALYVPEAERLAEAIARLNRFAASRGIPVISTTDAHRENDAEFQQWPPHCVAGTLGQQKVASTLLDKRVVVPASPGAWDIDGAQQIIVEKQALDLFTNPNLNGVLARLAAERWVVYGVVTEYCVRCAALGLLGAGGRVELVTDAIQTLNEEESRRTLEEFTSGGGHLTTLASAVA
ncbi:MAG: cysteine hydrolase [Bryobacteraceae bacterium]|nr:cysteine hydrolase [Bryobacteraceae bacterium]